MAGNDVSVSIVVAAAIMMFITTAALATRLWVRIGILSGPKLDDVLISASWVFAMGICSASIGATRYGFGKHIQDVPERELETFFKLVVVCSTTFSCGVALAKASFAALYLRILQSDKLAIVNKVLVAFLLCQALEESLIVIFQCRPIAKAWNTSRDGTCISLVPMWWITFVFNLTTDLILFTQPIPSLWRLRLPMAKRIGLIVMLSLGLLVCINSVIRIVYVSRIGTDLTYQLAKPMIWSMIEISSLIFCSCIPSLRQVVQKMPWLNRLVGLASSRGSSNHYNHQFIGRWKPWKDSEGSKSRKHGSRWSDGTTVCPPKEQQQQQHCRWIRLKRHEKHSNHSFGSTGRSLTHAHAHAQDRYFGYYNDYDNRTGQSFGLKSYISCGDLANGPSRNRSHHDVSDETPESRTDDSMDAMVSQGGGSSKKGPSAEISRTGFPSPTASSGILVTHDVEIQSEEDGCSATASDPHDPA